jgi:hypothetical protein
MNNNKVWALFYNGEFLGVYNDKDKMVDVIVQFYVNNSSTFSSESLWQGYLVDNDVDEDEADFRDVIEWLKCNLRKDIYFLQQNSIEGFTIEGCILNTLGTLYI